MMQSQQQVRRAKRTAGRRAKPTDCDQDKAKYEEKHITAGKLQPASPEASRTDADVQQGQHELKLGEVFNTLQRGKQQPASFTEASKDTEVIYGDVKAGTKINCYLKENQSEFPEKAWLKELVKNHSEHQPSRQLRKIDFRKSKRP